MILISTLRRGGKWGEERDGESEVCEEERFRDTGRGISFCTIIDFIHMEKTGERDREGRGDMNILIRRGEER